MCFALFFVSVWLMYGLPCLGPWCGMFDGLVCVLGWVCVGCLQHVFCYFSVGAISAYSNRCRSWKQAGVCESVCASVSVCLSWLVRFLCGRHCIQFAFSGLGLPGAYVAPAPCLFKC